MTTWFLEGYLSDGETLQRVMLEPFPVVFGRQEGLALAGASPNMSRYHAELALRGRRLILRDLGSRNGTFVNRERIVDEHEINAGDVIHFADAEFRLARTESATAYALRSTAVLSSDVLPNRFPTNPNALHDLIEGDSLNSVFQPIVSMADDRIVGFECLTRGEHSELPKGPSELLEIAAASGHAVDLSERMRSAGLAAADAGGLRHPLFVNIHPREVGDLPRLLAHLDQLARAYPHIPLVLELHETAIPALSLIADLAAGLKQLGVELAYDDFGAGQARLMELVETPPHYLKFDRSLLADIDRRPESQHRMVGMLVNFARERSIRTLAEGISRSEEARSCRALGFDLAQGYLYGEPLAL